MVVSVVILNEAKHDKHGSLRINFSLCYFNSANFRPPFLNANAILGPGSYTATLFVLVSDREKKPLKQYGAP